MQKLFAQSGHWTKRTMPKLFVQLGNWTKRTIITANGVAAIVIGLLMIITTVDVCRRYFFGQAIVGIPEFTETLMVFIIFLSLAYTQALKQHLQVGFIVDRLPKRLAALVNTTTLLLALLFFGILTWRCAVVTEVAVRFMEYRFGVVHILLWPSRLAATIGSFLICVQLVMDLKQHLSIAWHTNSEK